MEFSTVPISKSFYTTVSRSRERLVSSVKTLRSPEMVGSHLRRPVPSYRIKFRYIGNTKITVTSSIPFSKRYLKYLTKKFLKKNSLRDWIRYACSSGYVYSSYNHVLQCCRVVKGQLPAALLQHPVCFNIYHSLPSAYAFSALGMMRKTRSRHLNPLLHLCLPGCYMLHLLCFTLGQ